MRGCSTVMQVRMIPERMIEQGLVALASGVEWTWLAMENGK